MLDFIYSVKDKKTGLVGYIGVTNNPNARMVQHLSQDAWFQTIDPDVDILEVVKDDRKHAFLREKYWIRSYVAEGAKLTNIQHYSSSTRTQKGKREHPTFEYHPANADSSYAAFLQAWNELGW